MSRLPQNENESPTKSAMRCVFASYALFLLSLPLPAVEAVETASSRGPASCLSALFLSPAVIVAMPVVILAEPRLIVLLFLPVATILTLANPLFLRLNRRIGLMFVLSTSLLSLIAVAFIPAHATGVKHIGYFVWVLSQIGFVVSSGIGLWGSTDRSERGEESKK